MTPSVRIAVVGLHFGAAFAPIYRSHPNVAAVGICDLDQTLLARVGDDLAIAKRYSSLDELLASGEFDAVHLATPVPLHVEQSVATLSAGLHCACAVPMATDIDGLRAVIEAQRISGKHYMMMETARYTREYLYAEQLRDAGRFGEMTLLRGTYYQDLEGAYPRYWRAQPPMHYATHVLAPLLALANSRAARVCCFGSGRLRSDLQQPSGTVFPVQTAIFELTDSTAAMEITKSWFQIARPYTESFCVYGERCGFEWTFEDEEPYLFTLEPLAGPDQWGRHVSQQRVRIPDRADLLPEPVRRFTADGHGGSHPHLVHEFIRSIIENRPPAIDSVTAADWCAPGICANESALRAGAPVEVPGFGP